MKTKTLTLIIFLGLVFLSPLTAPAQQQLEQPELLAPADMDTLTGPIALYPDALIGIILPASTFSDELVQAANFLNSYGAQAQNLVDSQPWDQSVRALARYPDVLQWMNENLAWTQQLGYAFAVQPEDVMNSIQRLRAQAQAAGNLTTNEQQTVLAQDNYIRIVPTYQDVIYVPYYDPMLAFYQPVAFGWGPAWAVGPWLVFDCNWVGLNVWFGTWSPRYFLAPPWRMVNRRPLPPQWVIQHTWRPARPPARPPSMGGQQRPPIVRPAPFAGGRAPGNTSAPMPDNLRHRPTVPQNHRTPTPAPAASAATTADIINQSITPTPRAQTRPQQPQAQTQTSQPQNNNVNNGNRHNVQHPSTPPPAHYAPQSQSQPAQRPVQQPAQQPRQQQPAQQTRQHQPSQQPQQQVRQSGQQPARQAGQENKAPASNTAPANSSRPAPPSPPPAPPPQQQQQQSTQSSSSSNSSSSSDSDSNSRQDSSGRPRR